MKKVLHYLHLRSAFKKTAQNCIQTNDHTSYSVPNDDFVTLLLLVNHDVKSKLILPDQVWEGPCSWLWRERRASEKDNFGLKNVYILNCKGLLHVQIICGKGIFTFVLWMNLNVKKSGTSETWFFSEQVRQCRHWIFTCMMKTWSALVNLRP